LELLFGDNMHIKRKIAGFTFGFFLLIIPFFSPLPAKACDPSACFMSGHKSDITALVTVTSIEGNLVFAEPDHYYKETKIRPDVIRIGIKEDEISWREMKPRLGGHYLVSLSCDAMICYPEWGIIETDSSDHLTAKFLNVENGDKAVLEWYMNDGQGEIYFEGDKVFVRVNGEEHEIFPGNYEYPRGIFGNDAHAEVILPIVILSILFVVMLLFFPWKMTFSSKR
jgi:hypothetical protein